MSTETIQPGKDDGMREAISNLGIKMLDDVKIISEIVPHPPRPTVSIEADMQKLMAVPADKLSDMKLYAAKLRAKFPWMKPNRVKRKVAEYFKIKLT